ncbi:MAG: hypothetical protein RSC28_09460 [Bacteroidales bacterium]
MSLIVLVITILVMIILAGVVVVSLTKNNPIGKAGEALFKSDIGSFKDELNLGVISELAKSSRLQKTDINAIGKDMLKYIPSMTDKYIDKLEIVDAELVFIGDKESEKEWADNIGLPSVTVPGTPVISAGLTPIKWVNNAVKDTDVADKDWFNYSAKNWANARTADNSMWTWIPRYAYRIIYYDGAVDNNVGSGNIIGYSDNRGLVDANGNASTSFNRLNGRVEVVFLGADNFKYLDGTNYVGDVRLNDNTNNPNHYVVHPAFSVVRRTGYTKRADGNFGNTKEIPGFWVSKFEMSAGCTSKSGVASQREMTISAMFAEGKKISATRGITGGDSNAMTNTQWGAVAYLTKAIGKEPETNTSHTCIAGNGDYKANVLLSTTGNVTGVYDMNGCTWEIMSSYTNSGTLTDASGKNLKDNKDTKYVDVYAVGSGNTQASNYAANADKYGDAQYEVSSSGLSSSTGWSGDYSTFTYYKYPVFYRGGLYGGANLSGVFAFTFHAGDPNICECWRRGFHYITLVPFSSVYSKLCKFKRTKNNINKPGKVASKLLFFFAHTYKYIFA